MDGGEGWDVSLVVNSCIASESKPSEREASLKAKALDICSKRKGIKNDALESVDQAKSMNHHLFPDDVVSGQVFIQKTSCRTRVALCPKKDRRRLTKER